MPWTEADAVRHTKIATTPKLRRQWAHIANSSLERGLSEGRAIASANAVIRRQVASRIAIRAKSRQGSKPAISLSEKSAITEGPPLTQFGIERATRRKRTRASRQPKIRLRKEG